MLRDVSSKVKRLLHLSSPTAIKKYQTLLGPLWIVKTTYLADTMAHVLNNPKALAFYWVQMSEGFATDLGWCPWCSATWMIWSNSSKSPWHTRQEWSIDRALVVKQALDHKRSPSLQTAVLIILCVCPCPVVHVWRLEDNLGRQSYPSTLFKKQGLMLSPV